MKNLIIIMVAAFGLIGVQKATAQTYAAQTISLGVAAVNPGDTTNILQLIDVRKQDNVAMALKFNCSVATNVVPLSIVFDKSVDGTNWSDKDTFTWSYTRDGTTNSIVATTNITCAGYGYLRLKTIAAPGAAGVVTLESFKYGIKIPAK